MSKLCVQRLDPLVRPCLRDSQACALVDAQQAAYEVACPHRRDAPLGCPRGAYRCPTDGAQVLVTGSGPGARVAIAKSVVDYTLARIRDAPVRVPRRSAHARAPDHRR